MKSMSARFSLMHFAMLLGAITSAQFTIAQVTVAQISDTHIGEKHSPHATDNLKNAVKMIKSPLYFAPGNHDVHTGDVDRYRKAFGKDYYDFDVKNVKFVVIDSQLLGGQNICHLAVVLLTPELGLLGHVD